MRRNRLFLRPWARRLVIFAVLTQVFVSCGESEPIYTEVPFELEDGRTSWKGSIIGLVVMPRVYRDHFFGQPVSPEQAAEMQAGQCVALLGELSPVRTRVPDILDVPAFWLPGLEGGSPIGGRGTARCDTTAVRAAGYWMYGHAGVVPAGGSLPFYMPYYIESEISESVVVSVEYLIGGEGVTVETSLLAAVPPATRQPSTGARLIEVGEMDRATFVYSRTWETDTITWSGNVHGLKEYDLPAGYVLSETGQGWTDPHWRCIAVLGSWTLSYDSAEKPQWFGGNTLLWPTIGLIAGGRVINSDHSQCSIPHYDFGLDPGSVLRIFSVPSDVEIEGVMVDPWGEAPARYEVSI